jgi:hypothetical protein
MGRFRFPSIARVGEFGFDCFSDGGCGGETLPGRRRHPGGNLAMSPRHALLASLAVALLLPASGAKAGPQEIVDKLRQTPPTLFDLSLVRLEAMVGAVGAARGFSAGAYYQDGEIRITALSSATKQSRAACKTVSDQLKASGGIDLKTGFAKNPASAYASLFAYPSIDQFSVDESYAETVDGMIVIEVSFERFVESMVCKSRLLSKEVTYEQEPKR